MSVKVVMPQVGESVVEGTIDRWLKQEGDRVEKYESLVEIITDKVNTEIPAPAAGVLSKITAPSGTIVAVGQEIAVIEGEEAVSAFEEEAPAEAVEAALAPAMEAAPSAKKVEVRGEERVRASPAVRRLAQEHNLDISLIRGTGMGGRVTKEDVLNYVAQRDGGRAAVAQPEARPEAGADEEIVELTPIRRIIAENMVRSFTTIP
ncbi:MAG: biotin/lipoyl-containing protein, partial [Dehalococcoidia bacterium]